MGNWSWNQKPQVKEIIAVSKQCDQGLIFRWSESLISHDNEASAANSPEILLSVTSSDYFSVLSFLHLSLLFDLWTLSCLSILRKILFHFTVLLKPLCPCCLVTAWLKAAPAGLPFLPVVSFPFVLKDCGAGRQIVPFSSAVSLPLPPGCLLPWLAPLLASMTHHQAFPLCPFCLITSSWLPKCWWFKTGGTCVLHPSLPRQSCLIPHISIHGA